MRTILLIATILTSATAHAQHVGIVATGDAALQPQLAAELEVWLHNHGRYVIAGAVDAEAINTLIDCFVLEDLNCARAVVERRARSTALVFARAEVTTNEDGTREIAVTAYWFQKGHDALAERRVCTRCNDRMLKDSVDDLMRALVHDPPPPLMTAPLAPAPARDADLERPSEAAQATPNAMLPIALIAVGGAGLVAGGIMIAIDEDADPNGVQDATYRDTATGGAVLGLAGAAALGAGVYLWWTARPRSAPVAAISRDAAYLGWAGRF